MTTETSVDSAVSGRLPVLPGERMFTTAGSFMRTCLTFGSAIWVLLVGSALPTFGNTRLAILGYTAGLIIGFIPVVFASGLPCFRYGVDTVDASKSAFGLRGAFVPLLGILGTSLIWITVIMAMAAQWLNVHLVAGAAAPNSAVTAAIAIAILVLVGVIVHSGPALLQRLNDFVGPLILVLSAISLWLLVRRFGWEKIWSTNVPAATAVTQDGLKGVSYALEYGIATSLAWWPFLGGLFRLVRFRKHVVGPSMIGLTVVGGAFGAAVAALAAANLATTDPLNWIVQLAGPIGGPTLVILVLLANIPTMGMLLYFAAVSVQQVSVLAKIPRAGLLMVLLLPSFIAAFRAEQVLGHVLTVAAYVGMQFVVVNAIGWVDYFLLRRERLEIAYLFHAEAGGPYWFWGGVNWVAVLTVVLGTVGYFAIYNPVSLEAHGVFRYVGASLPVMGGCAIFYYVSMRLAARAGVGGYPFSPARCMTNPSIKVKL